MSQTRTISTGLCFGEGPRWHEGRLWFSDVYVNRICSVSVDGDLRVELEWDEQPSGLGWLPGGDLLFVSMQRRSLFRWDGRSAPTLHADMAGIQDFHANDMVVDAAGRAYVGNFGFDLHGEMRARGVMEVFASHPTASIALVQPDGAVEEAAAGLHFPNGTVITPDGRTLVVGETLGGVLTAFTIGEDGRLSDRRPWAVTAADPLRPRVPDGICLDAEGAIWFANLTAPECVRVAEGGAVLQAIETSQPCFACMLGGEDRRTLFMMTAPTSDEQIARAEPLGRIEIADVAVPSAGRP